jgi:hypothetical protein
MAKIVLHREIKFALLSDNQPRKNLSNWEEFEKVVRALQKRLGLHNSCTIAPKLRIPEAIHR